VAGIDAADLIAVLRAENIYARRYFYPGCHRLEPYRSQLAGRLDGLLPETDHLASRVVCLPNGTSIGAAEIDTICNLVRLCVREAPALRARLAGRSA
jgi:dTDP-4-amino-4,6-dideoxygalactose transaminase